MKVTNLRHFVSGVVVSQLVRHGLHGLNLVVLTRVHADTNRFEQVLNFGGLQRIGIFQ
jgi:hypothetical protein